MTGVPGHEESEQESEEVPCEAESEIETRDMNSEMCEVSDPELWMHFHHGDDSPDTLEAKMSETELALRNTMRERNEFLTAREHRLEAEQDEAKARHDLDAMNETEGLIAESRGLRYSL